MSLIIGFGTGRCGSKSLSEFLGKQPNFHFRHEGFGITWDTFVPAYRAARKLIGKLLEEHEYVGDISPMWINYIPFLIEDFPEVKFIWLDRDCNKEVVESYHHYKKDSPFVSWNDGDLWNYFPVLEGRYSKEAIDRAVCRYSRNAYIVYKLYPNRSYHLKMRDMVHRSKQKHLLKWLGVPKELHEYGMGHTHKREDMLTEHVRQQTVVEIDVEK